MLSTIFETDKQIWNINMVLEQEGDNEIDEEDDDEEEESNEKENTPDLEDDIFNEEHTAASVELF